jgi:hypothetical protein
MKIIEIWINKLSLWILHCLPQDVVGQYARDQLELFSEDEFNDAGAERGELRRECMG